MSDFQVSPELLTIYLEDARQHLESLDHCLLTLEREGIETEVISAVLGPLHTLKGNSGMMGFGAVKDYVHRLEDVFARVSEGSLKLTAGAFDRLFAGATALRDAVESACRERSEVRDLRPEKADLERLLSGEAAVARPRVEAALEPPVPPAPAPASRAPASAAPPMPPTPAAMAPAPTAMAGAPDEEAAARTASASATPHVAARSNMVRVDFGQLDHLLILVGELIIYRTKLHEIG